MTAKDDFTRLCAINVNDHVEKKKDSLGHELSYLSWPWAIEQIQKNCEEFSYEIVRQENGLPYVYDPNTGYLVTTRVTIDGVTREMWLPVMNGANKAMKSTPYTYKTRYGEKVVEAATMFDINTAIMRCLVKNLAMFGLGLYIYAGEDLPVNDTTNAEGNTDSDIMDMAAQEINHAQSIATLTDIYNNYSMLHGNKQFMAMLTDKKKQLK